MQMKWIVNNGKEKYQLNLASYSSLFVTESTNEDNLLRPVMEFFQPRSKVKDVVTVRDYVNDLEEITHHAFTAFELSNNKLREETLLGSKSLLKSHLKSEFSNHLETDGYILTINTLANDLLSAVNDDLPVKLKSFTIDSFIKLLEVDFSIVESDNKTNRLLSQNKLIVQTIKKHLKMNYKNSLILFFMFPELNLSPKEQLTMKEFLLDLSNDVNLFVVTNSKHFISDELAGMNYFSYGRQLFTDEMINDLEWESPLPYSKEELLVSLSNVIKNHIDMFELIPTISNYIQSEIVIFKAIDLYVLIFILNKLKFKYQLDLNPEIIDRPVFEYVMDVYEKI